MASGSSALTAETIAEATDVPKAKLDLECSEHHVIDTSLFLKSWRTLAPHLKLVDTDIEEIDQDGRTEQEKRLKTLQKWRERFIFRATYKILMEALLKTGRADHARRVCCLLRTIPVEDTGTLLASSRKRVLELESQLKSQSDELSMIRKRLTLDDSTTEETMDREPCTIIPGVEAASSKNLEKEETDVVKGKEQGHIFSGIAEGESSGSCDLETQPNLSTTDGLATDRIIEEETTDDPGIEFATVARRFIIKNGKSHQFELQGYGLRVLVPDDVLPAHVQQSTVDVQVSLSGKYNIGDDYESTSAKYWLSCPEKFLQPVTLEVQHSAVMDDPSSPLCFVVARSNELPHKFRRVEGGVFSPSSRYGSFRTKELSGWGIVVPRGGRQYYRGQLWYSQISDTKWKIYFTITVDLDAVVAVSATLLLGNPVKGHATRIDFEGDELQIDIPSEGITAQGWEITPRNKRVISKYEVTSFTSVRLFPMCEMDVKWKQKDEAPGPLSHSFSLVGAKGPSDKLILELSVERSHSGEAKIDTLLSAKEPIASVSKYSEAPVPEKGRDIDLFPVHTTAMEGLRECLEYQIIRTNLPNITQLISSDPSAGPMWFAQKLEEKAFIASAACAVVVGYSKYDQTSALMGAVVSKIQASQEPGIESAKFIDILRSIPPLEGLAKKLVVAFNSKIRLPKAKEMAYPSQVISQEAQEATDNLTLSDLKTILEELCRVAYKWKSIGTQLSLEQGVLMNIQYICQNDDALQEVITEWLKRVSLPPTWKALVEALRSKSVGEERLALSIEQKYCLPTAGPTLKELDHPTLKELDLITVSDWYGVGLQLDLEDQDLDYIERECTDNRRCSRKMFKLWLKTSPNPTYVQLAKALILSQEERLAYRICQKYGIPKASVMPGP